MNFNHLFRKKPVSELSAEEHEDHGGTMAKVLRTRDLTFFGIAAIIGGGAFRAIGSACNMGGPAVIVLFVICAIACGFTAMCYAEFAARVPFSGSAYTYAYVSFGELFAWIIGWALLMEYSIGNIYIAFSWSGYFTNLLDAAHCHLPEWLTTNYKSAHAMYLDTTSFAADYAQYLVDHAKTGAGFFKTWLESSDVVSALKAGKPLASLYDAQLAKMHASEGFLAWTKAPLLGGLHIIFDMPAVVINGLITWLVYVGVKESRNFSNLMVMIKLAVIVLVIVVGVFYIDFKNWTPFMPNGFGGVMAGAAGVFFAYIGFDAVSTLAEESENPQRDLPRGMIYSLIICTIAYIVLSLVLTGMVNYRKFAGVSDPLAFVFAEKAVQWMLYIISIAAVVAMTSVLLVFQMGQPRIWMSMSRDGLLPKRFSQLHKKYKTPAFSTVITGLVVGVPLFFTDENFVLDFTSIGTLFAFVLVCGGVLMLPRRERTPGKFHLPYINAKWILPVATILSFVLLWVYDKTYITSRFSITADNAANNIPMLVFFVLCFVMALLSFLKNLSLIPVLGLLSCCYLLTGMAASNWIWFGMWLLIGLGVYNIYGRTHSRLHKVKAS